jgi:outer membrane protein assembly factor BamB
MAAAVTVLVATLPASASWERFHGDAANSGFADVATAPAGRGSRSVPGLGHFAPGAGPVVAADGTVYLGTLEGKLIALHADGTPFWSRDITPGQAIVASPAVGTDGSVYVVGTKKTTIRDHRVKPPKVRTVFESTLHKFTSSGGWVGQTPFPNHRGSGGITNAPPNIVRIGSLEAVLVPAVYRLPPATLDRRLIAFSTDGAVLLDQRIRVEVPSVTGGAGSDYPWVAFPLCMFPVLGQAACLLCGAPGCDFEPRTVDRWGPPPPMPGAAVFTSAAGGAPLVIVTDQRHEVVGYTFSSKPALTERFRVRSTAQRLLSPPMVLPDGQILVGTADGAIVFTGSSTTKLQSATGFGPVIAAPTRTVTGFAVAGGLEGLALLRNGKVVSRASLPAPSYTSAAASRTHVFVSTTDAFVTFDAEAQAPLLTFDWVGGGTSPPAIGPGGHVYAIASDILFVFPPPKGGG